MYDLPRHKTTGEKEKMNQAIIINLVMFCVGYVCGIGTIVLMAQLIKNKFGGEGAKTLIKK